MIQPFARSSRRVFSDLDKPSRFALIYHSIFDYPLTFSELIKWRPNPEKVEKYSLDGSFVSKDGFTILAGREGGIYKRELRRRISKRKMVIAEKTARVLRIIPTIKMIAVTGSLAMESANAESDIDFMVVTQKGTLWTTRLFAYVTLFFARIPTRKAGNNFQNDRLCLNVWLDESDLVWHKRNFFTSHEIAQIKPLLNRAETYEKFIYKNRWIGKFWPNALKIKVANAASKKSFSPLTVFEGFARTFQLLYMKNKVTRETVTATRALFHPIDWSEQVRDHLALYLDR